jgi:hypothetical protein
MADDSPALSRLRLTRILGLSKDASPERIGATTPQLLNRLLRRLDSADEMEAIALGREIADLATSSARFTASPEANSTGEEKIHRRGLLGVTLAVVLTIGVLVAYAAGFRIHRVAGDDDATLAASPAVLILDGRLPGATLRVLDADREELLLKGPAEGARVELAPGRYAIDVSREDCPDHWTQSVYFEEGTTHRFEPLICLGEGRLTVRSNVTRDRLRIDGLDVGPTREEPHILGVGDHELRVEKAGYETFLGKVRIRPGEEIALHAELLAGSGERPAGRPMPVQRTAPANAPSTAVRPEAFDPSTLGSDFGPDAGGLGHSRRDLLPSELLSGRSSGGGSTAWHDRVSRDLIARYDLDRSGQIDQLEESETISCRVWLDIERDFDGGGLGLSMVRYYGFDGSEWHPNALGFARSHRSAVFEKMKECGLQT